MTYRTGAERAELAWRFHGLASTAFGGQVARAGMKQLEAEEHYYAVARAIGFTEADAYALLSDTLPSTEDDWWAARQLLYVPRQAGRVSPVPSRLRRTFAPPPLAIDGHKYRQRQRNRVKRRRR